MLRKKIFAIGALVIASLGLGACVDQYGYGRAPGYGYDDGYGVYGGGYGGFGGYDQFWGDPFGWQRVPVGYLGTGFGWNNGFYYPGNGGFVYDRRGMRRAWNQQQRAFWQPRIVHQRPVVRPGYGNPRGNPGWGNPRGNPGWGNPRGNQGVGNVIGGSIARQGLPPGQVRQREQVIRQQDRVIRQQGEVQRQQGQVQRQQNRMERQAQRPQNRPQAQAYQGQRPQMQRQQSRPQSSWQGGQRSRGEMRGGGGRDRRN